MGKYLSFDKCTLLSRSTLVGQFILTLWIGSCVVNGEVLQRISETRFGETVRAWVASENRIGHNEQLWLECSGLPTLKVFAQDLCTILCQLIRVACAQHEADEVRSRAGWLGMNVADWFELLHGLHACKWLQ